MPTHPLCVALLGAGFSPRLNLGAGALPAERGCRPSPSPDSGAQVKRLSPCQSCVLFCSFVASPPPFLVIDFRQESKLLRRPWKWGGGPGRRLGLGVLPKAWLERSGSSGALLSGTP